MKTLNELREEKPVIEIDDVHAASAMLDDIHALDPEMRVMVLARWAARLREYYVEIGRAGGSG